MAQSEASTKRLTAELKCIQQLVSRLETKHAKEFAVVPYDGLIIAMHKTAFAKTTATDSLIYELTSFGGTSGTGLLQYMTPGSIIPLFPSEMKATDDVDVDVEITAGHRFLDRVFILSGAEHVDKTEQLIPNVHKYDTVIASMARAVRNTERDRQFSSFSNNVGADVLDATSDDALTADYITGLFVEFFPHIGEDERQDYVVYVACHAKAAVDYVLSNLNVLDSSRMKGKCGGLFVSPKTMRVAVDNERLCVQAPTYCRMLVCNDNEVMLKPDDVEKFFGSTMRVRDPVLMQLNKTLKDGMVFDKEVCAKLPSCKFLVSMMASSILYDHPTPVQLLPLEVATPSVDMLAERINVIKNIYVKNNHVKSKMKIADQLACMSLGILKRAGISPESLRVYRTDNGDVEKEENRSPWPAAYHQYIKRAMTNLGTDADETEKFKEAMATSVFHLLTVINYRDHIFNADVFKNALELYDDFVQQHPEKRMGKPDTNLNHMRIKPLCSQSIFRGQLFVVQSLFARFHYDPVAFKRFFVANALFYMGDQALQMDDSVAKATVPESIEIINGKGCNAAEPQAEYTCAACGGAPFYERSGAHCLCFLLLNVVATLNDEEIDSLAKLKRTYDDYITNISGNRNFNGPMTSYKTVHNITVNEAQSSSGHFGKIQLKHAGKANAFGARNKPINEVEGQQQQANGNDVKSDHENDISSYLETRKMEWVTKRVKTEMKRLATIGDSSLSEKDDVSMRNNPLWSLQKLWLPESDNTELEDLRCFVTGTKDNPVQACHNAVLSGLVCPLLVNDPLPTTEQQQLQEQQRQHQQQQHSARSQNDDEGWECNNDGDDDNDCDQVKAKKPKLSYRAIAAQKMESLMYSVLYKLTSVEYSNEPISVKQIHPRHRELIKKWNEKPKKYNALFRETLVKIVLGANRSTYDSIDVNDDRSVIARVVKGYLDRLPAFISNVHQAVAKTLQLNPQELDDDFSKIVHYTEKTKRELVSWLDIGSADTLNKRSTMLTLFEVVRHEVEARATNMAAEAQTVSKANAETILHSNSGPYCRNVAGDVKLHVPKVSEEDMPVLSINETAAKSSTVAFEMYLPVKMKVSLNITQMDDGQKESCSAKMDDSDDDAMVSDDYRRFVPVPLLNTVDRIAASSRPVMTNTPKPANELVDILKDEDLFFSRVGTSQFADVTKTSSTVQILRDYISRRTDGKRVQGSHNLIMHGYFGMINRALMHVSLLLKSTVSLLSSVVPIGSTEMREMRRISDKVSSDVAFMKVLESGVHAVCKHNPPLASSLYLMALCSELYGPACISSASNMDLERDNHALNAMVAGCLRLFVGRDDCDKTTKKAESRQVRLVPVLWTYLRGRERPYVTSVDVSRCSTSQMMLTLQMGSYTSAYGNSAVYTSVRGGAALTRGVSPIINNMVKTQFTEGEYNHILCNPLVKVCNRLTGRNKDTIRSIVEAYPLQVFIRYVLENTSTIPTLLSYYATFLTKALEECPEDDLWEACMKAHRMTKNDDDTNMFKDVLFPKLYAAMTGSATVQEDYEEEEDAEDDDEEEDYWSESD